MPGITRLLATRSLTETLLSGRGAASRTVDPSLFSIKLEGRIDNLKKGRTTGEDLNVDAAVRRRDAAVYESLAYQNPNLLGSYNGFLSGQPYARNARIVAGVEYALKALETIPSEEEAKKGTDKIVAAYRVSESAQSNQSPASPPPAVDTTA